MPTLLKPLSVALCLLLIACIFWICLMVQAIWVMTRCPEKCWCDPGGDTIDCTGSSLQEIPPGFYSDISTLILDQNNFTVLRKDMFLKMRITELEDLSLEKCNISVADPGTFNGLSVYDQLDLSDNFLTEIKQDLFENMSRLDGLHLAGNRLQNLEPGIFLGLKSLWWISLESNHLVELNSDVFIGLTNLRNLWLSYNRLSYLHPDVFQHLQKLELLSLKGNNEIQIPIDNSFLNIPTLRKLYISACNLSFVVAKSFENITNLNELGIENNAIETVHKDIFVTLPKLYALFLDGNPLNCDCRLQEIWQWTREHDVTVGNGDEVPKCNAPEQVSGLWWGVLGKSQCLDGSIEFYGNYKSINSKPELHYFDSNYEFVIHMNYIRYSQAVIYAVLFVFGSVGNATVLLIIIRNKEMRSVPNAYIINLAVADLLSLIMNLPLYYTEIVLETWQLGQFLCTAFTFSRHLSIGISAYSVVILSIQRYQVTVNPFHTIARSPPSKRKTFVHIIGVWILVSCMALPSALSMYLESGKYCNEMHSKVYYKKVVIFELLVFCIIPLCVIVSMYVLTAVELVRSARLVSQNLQHPQSSKRKNTAKTVLGLTLVFLISFVPYYVMWTYYYWNSHFSSSMDLYVVFISSCLLFFNSCFNPVALCLSSSSFGGYFKRYLFCCSRRKVQNVEHQNTTESPFNEDSKLKNEIG